LSRFSDVTIISVVYEIYMSVVFCARKVDETRKTETRDAPGGEVFLAFAPHDATFIKERCEFFCGKPQRR
jgi:hypothetical protein